MEVKKVIPSGYCKGVINAIKLAKQTALKYPNHKIYIIGMLVHNKYIVDAFTNLNIITLDDSIKTKSQLIDEISQGVVIFTAHGIDPKIKQKAIDKGLIVVDATCDDVIKSSKLCCDYLIQGYDILYIGKKNHPESDAVLALSNKIHLITDEQSIIDLKIANKNILITNQTTMSILDIAKLIDKMKQIYPNAIVAQEICNATRKRQEALLQLENIDALVVVGDPKSNNTAHLAKIGLTKVSKVFKIENAKQLLEYDLSNIKSIAVTAGASTPSYLTNQVIEYLKTNDIKYLTIDIDKVLEI